MTRYELAQKTNAELTLLLNEGGDSRVVGFDDCSSITICRTHAINKLLVLAGSPEETWNPPNSHPTLEDLNKLGLLND